MAASYPAEGVVESDMSTKRDYYELLGIERSAGQDEIRKAFRKLARQHHPDVNPGNKEAEDFFKEINEAQEVLSDPQRRAAYDRYGHDGPQGGMGDGMGGASPFGDLFDMFFGAGSNTRGGGSGGSNRDGHDLRFDLLIPLEEAFAGSDKTIKLTRQEGCAACKGSGAKPGSSPTRCPGCNGSGQVKHVQSTILGSFATVVPCTRCRGEGLIVTQPCETCSGNGRVRATRERTIRVPAGVDTGTSIRLTGEGDAGSRGGRQGDLYIVINVAEHDIFKRQGADLYCEIDVPFTTMALGSTITVNTLAGDEKLTIPAATRTGSTFRIRGKGMPDVNGRRPPGELYVIANVAVPTELNDEQKRVLREFALLSGDEGASRLGEGDKGFIGKVMDAFR